MVRPHPDVVGEPRAEDHASTPGDRYGVHPLRRIEDVVQGPVLVRHLDAGDPAWIHVDMERVIRPLRRDLELGVRRKPLLPLLAPDRIRAIVQAVLPWLLELLFVGMAPERHGAVVEHPLLTRVDDRFWMVRIVVAEFLWR